MLLDLADIARTAGLAVVEEPGWRGRGHPGEMRVPKSVTVHHTAGPATGAAPSLRTVRDGRPDLAGPLAHFLLARTGTVHVVAAGLCWHTGATFEPWQSNGYAIGIEVENGGRPGDTYPDVQTAALRALCRGLADHYGIPYVRVVGHREIAYPAGRKSDPVFDMGAFRASLTLPPEADVPLTPADYDAIAERVWSRPTRNGFGDIVRADQILVGNEIRAADVQARLGGLAGLVQQLRAGGVDPDAIQAAVRDGLARGLTVTATVAPA